MVVGDTPPCIAGLLNDTVRMCELILDLEEDPEGGKPLTGTVN